MTIIERAKQYADRQTGYLPHTDMRWVHKFDDYVRIACEQCKIDIEKAVELYKAEVQQCKNMLNYFKADAGDIIDIERSVDIFRKAMEEQI